MLLEVSTAIDHALSGGERRNVKVEYDEESDVADEDDPLDEGGSDADIWSNNSSPRELQDPATGTDTNVKSTPNQAAQTRIRSDLRLAKEAGFKIGILGNLNLGGIVSVSIRIAKLGISEEAINAWGLKRDHYLILLIRYGKGYRDIEEVKEESVSDISKTEFRVALCQQYKPSITEAINAFNQLSAQSDTSVAVKKGLVLPGSAAQGTPGTLEPLFIGRPLNDLLTRLPIIIKYRIACSFSWTGAEVFFNEIQAKSAAMIDPTQKEFNVSDPPASQALPKVVNADHIGETSLPRSMSLPFAAIQFLLRHFVRCTEFCLVCHCKTDTNFEALKPYVCSKPLCLFQYMTLGFGPSIEWEILSQPYVVDLLISFCYAAAQGGRLKDFPIGIDLKVPLLPRSFQPAASYQSWRTGNTGPATAPSTPSGSITPRPIFSKFDPTAQELLLIDSKAPGPLRIGGWIVVTANTLEGAYHARVEDVFFPQVRLGELVHIHSAHQRSIETSTSKVSASSKWVDAQVYLYDQSFDELPDLEKQSCIVCILDTLPDVLQMKAFLDSSQQDPTLTKYRRRISETALNLLRWIIASNRSCIMQVDRASSSSSSSPSSSFASAEDRVSGMGDWLQFRFAQGAPDKEQRFMNCVKEVSIRLKLNQYPTLFAWHGSPLANWHSIVREGLNFNDALHGRAFGDGVYMSSLAVTSIGYSGAAYYPQSSLMVGGSLNWPNSRLCVTSALALNEVVNAPDEFVHQRPHYVVNQIDWIQTRYLFIRGNHRQLGHNLGVSTPPKCIYNQDPKRTAVGEAGQAISIPINAISKSRRPVTVTSPQARGNKKAKIIGLTTQEQIEKTEDDVASMMTDQSDLEMLMSDADDVMTRPSTHWQKDSSSNAKEDETPKTDFIPGQLDASTLPLLAPPSNASSSATKALLSTLKQTLQIQKTTPIHELGWYINESLISNIYQWIVELHSFDPNIPLAQDMTKHGVKSIILEIRFSNNFPMSPPFVRVIRPRFLPFMQGGGGHVTAGGALCMELLTNSGWSPVSSVESVLLQVRMAMSSLEPKPARLLMKESGRGSGGAGFSRRGVYGEMGGGGAGGARAEYGVGEAVDAYKRACAIHGWQIPKEFDDFLKE